MGRWCGTAMKMKIGDEGLGEMGWRRGSAAWSLSRLGLIDGREVGLIDKMGLLVEWVGRSTRWVGAGDGSKLGYV